LAAWSQSRRTGEAQDHPGQDGEGGEELKRRDSARADERDGGQ
jgi:hypothetical protein